MRVTTGMRAARARRGFRRERRARRAAGRDAGMRRQRQRREWLALRELLARHFDLEGVQRKRDQRKIAEGRHQFDQPAPAEVFERCGERPLAQAVSARCELGADGKSQGIRGWQRGQRPALPYGVDGRLRNACLQRPVDPGAPFVRAVERARADRGDEAAHPHRDDRLVDLAAGVKVVPEMRDPGGEIGARVEQRDEGAG